MFALLLILIFMPFALGSIATLISKKYTKIREVLVISINLLEMILISLLLFSYFKNGEQYYTIKDICALGLSFKIDGFRVIYATLSIFLWLMTITFSKEYMHHYDNKGRYYFFYLLTLSGVVGVFFSADLITTFIFFEIMSLASYPLVIHDEKEKSMKSGETYIGIAIITGMILLMGIFMLYSKTNTVDIAKIKDYIVNNGVDTTIFISGILMLLGFGAKAGMYPLHIWLPKAHPVAPAPASALLSGILTKTGVYGIIIISSNIFFANNNFGLILLAFAVVTMFLGALLALFSVDIKRTLACSSMSQIGFILVGIAFMILLQEEGSIAALGAMLHMMNHSLIKLVLFMCSGVVAMNIHSLDLNEAKGFGRKKPFLMIMFLIGTLGIMGIPLFNGYVSKTMIHEAIVEYIEVFELVGLKKVIFKAIEYVFLFSGGLTIAYMTKLFVWLFVEKNGDEKLQDKYDNMKNYLSPLSRVVFVISSIMLPLIGILPNTIGVGIVNNASNFFNLEKINHNIAFFGLECLKGGLISIIIGGLVYALVVRKLLTQKSQYINAWPKKIDLEYLVYRPIICDLQVWGIKHVISPMDKCFEQIIVKYLLLIGLYFFKAIDVLLGFTKYLLLIGLYFFKIVALAIDFVVYIINITILKPQCYHFEEHSLSYKIGSLIDKVKKNKNHDYANKNESLFKTIIDVLNYEMTDFSFSLAMVCLGIILILVLVLVL